MSIAPLFVIDKTWKQLKSPSTCEKISTLRHPQSMGYYLTIIRNELSVLKITYMNLKVIIVKKLDRKKYRSRDSI